MLRVHHIALCLGLLTLTFACARDGSGLSIMPPVAAHGPDSIAGTALDTAAPRFSSAVHGQPLDPGNTTPR